MKKQKTIGLLGGIGWPSTIEYYRQINQGINRKLGGAESAEILLRSVNFGNIERRQQLGDWQKLGVELNEAALQLEQAGADFFAICANTIHKISTPILRGLSIPFVHIIDAVSEEIRTKNIYKVCLLGTKYTMTQEFYSDHLAKRNIETITPSDDDINFIHNSIHKELMLGVINSETKNRYIEIIEKAAAQGAEGVILGCTEIPLIVNQSDIDIPAFDTIEIHCNAIVKEAISMTDCEPEEKF